MYLLRAQLDARPEGGGVPAPDPAVDAVGRDDQVGVTIGAEVLDLGFEPQLDAERPRPLLQDVEQALARDAGEAVAAGADDVPLEVHVDVVPVLEAVLDRGRALRRRSSRDCPGSRWRRPRPSRRCRRGGCARAPAPRASGRAASSRSRSTARPGPPPMQTIFMQHLLAAPLANSLSLKCPISRNAPRISRPGATSPAARSGSGDTGASPLALGTAGEHPRYAGECPARSG